LLTLNDFAAADAVAQMILKSGRVLARSSRETNLNSKMNAADEGPGGIFGC